MYMYIDLDLRDFRISGAWDRGTGYMYVISGPIKIAYPLKTNLKNECAKH